MAIKNPEKECQTTPNSFSSESKIIGIEVKDDRRGIIFNTPEELTQALIIYDGGSVEGARATQNHLIDAVGDMGTGMGVAPLMLVGIQNANSFTKSLVQLVQSNLESTGRFYGHFDYDALGTNFFKTCVKGDKVGDKYVLELKAAYVGSEPENKLAKTLGLPMALTSASIRGNLSVVDDWWFNINLERILQGLPMNTKQLSGWPEYITSGGCSGKNPEIEFEHNSQLFSLDLRLNVNTYLRPERGKFGSEYIEVRGNNVVGGAWTNWDKDGERVSPIVEQPAVTLSVSLPGEQYANPPAVTEQQEEALKSARDYLVTLFKK